MDLGAMAMKAYSAFLKTPVLLEPHHQIVRELVLNWSICPIDRTIVGTTPARQIGPESSGIEELLMPYNWIICFRYCYRIHRLLLLRGSNPPHECPRYDTKPSDGEVPVMLELWGIWSIPLLLSFPGPLKTLSGTTTPA